MKTIFFILLRIIFYLIVIHGIHKSIIWAQEKFTKPKKRIIAMDNNIYHEVEEKIKNDKINIEPIIEPINNSNIQNNNNNPFIQNNNITNEDKTTPIDQLPAVEPDMKEQLKHFLKSASKTS